MRLRKPDWNLLRPRLGYAAFFLAAFVLALRLTFPAEAVKERIIVEAGARGWVFDAASVGPAGLLGFSGEGVRFDDQAGLTVPIDRLAASLRILPLLAGKRRLDLDVRIFDGRVRGFADVGEGERTYRFTIEGVELARALPLRTATRLELVGRVDGTVDVIVPEGPEAKPTGKIDLDVADAGVNGGQLQLPGMTSGFAVPKIALGAVESVVTLADGKGSFEALTAKGGDAELAGKNLAFTIHPRFAHSPLFGRAELRIRDAFWAKGGAAGLKGLVEAALASSRSADGAYGFQVYGTLAKPQLRPAKG
ncbi:MAG TPA: type II secretion system protein GspN [Anaeromyxobacteraceae bacterium]|nr:type II secretion system protein GspN [Anaeromyxobacteraceae bacterium]